MPDKRQVAALFTEARARHDEALKMLAQHRLRNAADIAWDATRLATHALILARTGEMPNTPAQTLTAIRQLRWQDPALESLRQRYGYRLSFLHRAGFHDGILEPEEDIIADVRATIDFIQDAEEMAGK